MFLYMSNATAYPIYDKLFRDGMIKSGYQMQKFNHNLIEGLGKLTDVISLSALPYVNKSADRIDQTLAGIRYIGVKNNTGYTHKISNLFYLYLEGSRIIKKYRPECIICDAIALSPCVISKLLGKRYNIPVVGIITDLPGMLGVENKATRKTVMRMQNFDGYILLTEQMNEIVNPNHKPYIIMEGLCASQLPELYLGKRRKVILYSGSLWKNDAGIEYLVQGFINAKLSEYELHLYGTGELVPWIEEISKEHQNVKYMGCVTNSEMVTIQSEAMLLVNPRPSKEEFCKYSFPSKTIEYMASGTPVLMARLPGVPSEYFDYVYTIEDETSEGMCKTLEVVLSKKEKDLKEFGARAREFVKEKKSQKWQSERVYKFIQEVNK
ncbi:hypothetical protein B5F37_01675 [Drancourtella sp. An210]|nr:hypothetical protein B5F37_01675 [Drancourtella sp. An210]